MFALIIYFVKSMAGMGIFLLFYKFFIKKLQHFNYNRFYLLFSVIISSLIPLINLSDSPVNSKIAHVPGLSSIQLQEFIVRQNNTSAFLSSEIMIYFIYSIGVLFFFGRMGWSLFRLYKLYANNEKKTTSHETLVFIPEGENVFSFFKWVFIPASLYQNENGRIIINHERIHIQQKHSIDLVIAEMIRALQWFNPVLYFIIKEMKENHEYLADQAMKKSIQSYELYKALLFQQNTGIEINPVANHFSYSLLKKRMKMMKTQKSTPKTWTRFGWTALALILVLGACNQSPEKKSETSKNASTKEVASPSSTTDTTLYKVVQQKPEFPGGTEGLIKYLGENIKYPEMAKKKKIQGRVFVQFVIEKDGSVSHVKVLKGIGGGCDKEAISVIEHMPKWVPGKENGKPVRVEYVLPIMFKLK